MNANHELDPLLNDLAAQPAPPLPANFAQNVQRQIRQQRDTNRGWFNWFLVTVLRPQTIAAALCVALLCGAITGFTISGQPKSGHVQLNAFSANAPGMLPISIN
jgi:anti-sigma factor RsiW